MRQITHAEAAALIALIRAELEQRGKGAAVAVVDAHGELMAFLRTDGCPLPSILIAQNKAFTAARQGEETADLGRGARESGNPLAYFGDARYIGWGGGVPLWAGGQVIGGLGVSGLPEAEDIEIARMAAATLQ